MNELNGPSVIIVLNIEEGRGFDFLTKPLEIEATLKGNKITSDNAAPDANPTISTQLIWETEKKEVRKLRSAHVPLRIECFTTNTTNERVRIGFILLNLRSARPITYAEIGTIEFQWYKLVGVRTDFKISRPELSLALTVRDRNHSVTTGVFHKSQALQIRQDLKVEQNVIPIMYLDDGLIQIGDNSSPGLELFTLSFLIGTASNLDLLLPESQVFAQNTSRYFIALSILGMAISTKYFHRNLHEPIVLNDRINFKLRSSLDILRVFFDYHHQVPLHFCYGQDILATAHINCKCLLKLENIRDKVKETQICEFQPNEEVKVEPNVERKPCVQVETALTKILSPVVPEDVPQHPNKSMRDSSPEASGDQIQPNEIKPDPTPPVVVPKEDAYVQTTPLPSQILIPSKKCLQSNTKRQLIECDDSQSNYKLFELTVTFLTLTWRKLKKIDCVQFVVHHPRADSSYVISCDWTVQDEIVQFTNGFCALYFAATATRIKDLVALYPPMVQMCDVNQQPIAEEFQLFTKLLESNGKNTCTYFAILNTKEQEELCDLQIQLDLTGPGTNLSWNVPLDKHHLTPVVLDENLLVKNLHELEQWKLKQQEAFEANLKRLEVELLAGLQTDWVKKRMVLEGKLHEGIKKCQKLSQELSAAVAEMQLRQMKLNETEEILESRESIEIRVTQMLEDEMNRKIARIEAEKEELRQRTRQLAAARDQLQATVAEQRQELAEWKKSALTREQTACLLQELRSLEEKCNEAHVTKAFFKEQWRKAVKEVHLLKSEDQQQIQQQIQQNKAVIQQLNGNRNRNTTTNDVFY